MWWRGLPALSMTVSGPCLQHYEATKKSLRSQEKPGRRMAELQNPGVILSALLRGLSMNLQALLCTSWRCVTSVARIWMRPRAAMRPTWRRSMLSSCKGGTHQTPSSSWPTTKRCCLGASRRGPDSRDHGQKASAVWRYSAAGLVESTMELQLNTLMK